MMYKTSPTCQIAHMSAFFMKHFGYKHNGAFVEVGASDGYSFSNTWGLAEAGWRGLYFEPIHALAQGCAERHIYNNVKVIESCVGDVCGEAKLWLTSNPTIDEETMRLSPWGEQYDPERFTISPVVTLNFELANMMWPAKFDLLVIDVEGAELQVLNGIDLWQWKPDMMIVETHEMHPEKQRHFHVDIINKYMLEQPYKKIQVDGLNTIWKRLI